MSSITYPSRSATDDESEASAVYGAPLYKQIVRSFICGLAFGIPIAIVAPLSPLLRLSQTTDNKKALLPRMMKDYFIVNFCAGAMAYGLIVDPRVTNPLGREGLLPYLGPITAEVPALGCLVASHLFYPGLWALLNEVTWRDACRECVRLSIKCFFAFSSVHLPGAIGIGFLIGTIFYPFKWRKQVKEAQRFRHDP